MNYLIKRQKWANQFPEVNATPAEEIYVILYMLSLFQINKSYPVIRMSHYAIKYFNEYFTGRRELVSHSITKVLEGIKRLSGYTENPKSPLSSSDLKRAFQYLGGVEMNLTNSRLMMILVLSFMGFLRFSELSNLKRSDFILHNTHMSIFIEKSKTDIYRKGHLLHLARLNLNLCPLDLTKRYFVLAGIDKQCDKYIFRGIENTKNGQKLRKFDKPLSYTTVRGYVLDLLANIGLDPKKFELHSLGSGSASAAANLGVNDRLFKKHGSEGRTQSEGQLRSRRYRIKTFSIKESRPLVIAPTLKCTRLNYHEKQCF